VLERPVAHATPDVRRLVLATAGTFVGTFALVLLAFALPRFCVWPTDTSPDE
jgi:hypothetical protein